MSIVNGVSDIAADLISGTFGPIGAAAASLAEQTFTDNTVEEMKANNEKYNDFLNYQPRTDLGKAANKGAMEAIGEGVAAVGEFYTENEDKIPDVVKSAVSTTVDTWNDLDEETRFALGNLATVGEVVPIGKVASLAKRGSKLGTADIMPDGTPALLQGSTPRLPAARTASTPNVDELGYTSGIEEGIISLINDAEVPNTVNAAQLMGLLKKRGVKDDEIEWTTFKDYVDTLGKKQIPLDEALRQAKDRSVSLEVIELPKGELMFSDYSPNGGNNYKELLFKFDTTKELMKGRKPRQAKMDKLRLELVNLKTRRDELIELRTAQMDSNLPDNFVEESPWLTSQGVSSARTAALKQSAKNELPRSTRQIDVEKELEENLKKSRAARDEIERATFFKAHWQGSPNILFHARVTDRDIAGGKSLGIDEIQSDWHQGKGNVANRPYYKLPEDQLEAHIEEQIKQAGVAYKSANKAYTDAKVHAGSVTAAAKVGKSLVETRKEFTALKAKRQKAEETLGNHRVQLQILKKDGYDSFTKDLRPNAPLKNKDKWMASALNAMLYKAVKEGYDSVSWPNGKTQSTLYNPHLKPSQTEALEKMYDTTVPNMLRKMAQKLDPDSVLVRGKHSSESNPMPNKTAEYYGEQEWQEYLDGGSIQDGDLVDQWGEIVEREVDRQEWNAENGFLHPDNTIEQDYDIYRSNTEGGGGLSFEEYKNRHDPESGYYDKVNSAYSHIKITPTMKEAILQGKPLFLAEGGYVTAASDIAADLISGTFGPPIAAGMSLIDQAVTGKSVEELRASKDKYGDFLNYNPRTDTGKAVNEGAMDLMGKGVTAIVQYYKENEDKLGPIPELAKQAGDLYAQLPESTRFALGNTLEFAELLPTLKVGSLGKIAKIDGPDASPEFAMAGMTPATSMPSATPDVNTNRPVVMARDVEEMPSVESPIVAAPVAQTTPKKTKIGYKLFRTDPDRPGELFPLFVDGSNPVAMNEWVSSKDVYHFTAANGKKYVPATTGDSILIPNGEVRQELLDLGFSKKPNNKAIRAVAYRPGFHAGDTPSSLHIGGKQKGSKKPDHRLPNQVWAEVEMPDDVDWQSVANSNATRNKDGSIQARTAEVTEGIPHGGHYRYKTNSNMVGNWMIGGAVKVNRILTDVEVAKINKAAGVEDLPRLKPRQDIDAVDKEMGEIVGFEDGVAGLTRKQTVQALKDQHYRRLTPVGEVDRVTNKRSTEKIRQNQIDKYAKHLKNAAVFRREAYTLDKKIQQTQLSERRVIHPEELLGKVGVPVVGDRSIRITGPDKDSRAIVDINGVPLDSKHIPEGGMEYSRDHGGWASMSSAAKQKITNFALAAQKADNDDVLGIYTAMARESINFSVDALVPMVKQLKAIDIPKKDIKAFDAAIRKGVETTVVNKKTGIAKTTTTARPDWLGLEHPDVMKQLIGVEGSVEFPRKGAGAFRKDILKVMREDTWQSKGFPNYDDVVDTMTVPELSDFKEAASGLTMFKPEFKDLDAEKKSTSLVKSDHSSYEAHIPGEYFGGLFASVPPHIMYPDTFKELSKKLDTNGKPLTWNLQIGSLRANPKLYEVYTPEKVDNIIKYLNTTHGTDYNKGGLVSNEMESLGFAAGGNVAPKASSIFDDMVA